MFLSPFYWGIIKLLVGIGEGEGLIKYKSPSCQTLDLNLEDEMELEGKEFDLGLLFERRISVLSNNTSIVSNDALDVSFKSD